jgi:hypothetical protein
MGERSGRKAEGPKMASQRPDVGDPRRFLSYEPGNWHSAADHGVGLFCAPNVTR